MLRVICFRDVFLIMTGRQMASHKNKRVNDTVLILDDAGETEPSSFWSLTVVARTQAPSYFGRSRRTARHHNTTLLAQLFTCAPPLTRRRARASSSHQTIYASGQGMNPVAK
jgi:hypothetical protein